ncbi:lipoyl synthase [Candidatus Peregrinibacteria bacterium]|nr:lipoyl synthase [Candidatus Peregrinibacteria bacterium]
MRVTTPQNKQFTVKLKNQQAALPKPDWLKIRPPSTEKFAEIRSLVKSKKLSTVCEEAHCPNMSECWSSGTATFMLMGDTCTRACRFCMVKSGNPKGVLDPDEPKHLAESVKSMGLDYVVLTCVTRDDLEDGGATHFANCIHELKKTIPGINVELLISDLNANFNALQIILDAQPEVLAHNVETIERLQRHIRDPRANYQKSLAILDEAKKRNNAALTQTEAHAPNKKSLPGQTQGGPPAPQKIYTKSALMLGLGETEEEVVQAMKDLRAIDVDIVTFGQYLQPSPFHIQVKEYVTPQQFKKYEVIAKELGFLYCASGPFVRSSYKAGELFIKNIINQRRER